MSYLVVVDAHSKWPEVFPMASTTAAKTIEVLRQLFSSDNGPLQFISDEFASFIV